MTLFFYIAIGVITFVAFLHAWAKKEYEVSRTVVLNKPKAEVYAFLRQLKNQSIWMPWYRNRKELQLKFKGEEGKPGATLYWKGDGKVEEGIQKITKIKDGKVIEFQMLILKPYKTLALMYVGVKELEPERTKMVWGMRGTHRFPATVFMLFYGIEKILGEDLEKGLQNLKKELEAK